MSVTKASRLLAIQCKPSSSKSVSLQLLSANAFVQQAGKGLFGLLPLGQRVISRLVGVIEKELDGIGAQKVSLPFIGAKELWEATGRWEGMGSELLRFQDRKKREFCLQPTAEEMMTDFMSSHSAPPSSSYPFLLYQTTNKFRDEMNPRFGLLRGREFLMNDMYSFDLSESAAMETYNLVCDAYDRILKGKLGLEVYKVQADSGVHGGSLSHEYHLKSPLEEDAMEECIKCGTHYKANEGPKVVCCEGVKRKRVSSIEVAHTFHLGKRYSEALNAYATLPNGRHHLDMCCFGIGVTRLLPAIVESLSRSHCSNDNFIHLPPSIQPFDVAVIPTQSLLESPTLSKLLSSLNEVLSSKNNVDPAVLLDDRSNLTLGRRVLYAQQIGVSKVVVLGKGTEKSMQTEPLFEWWSANPLRSEKLTKKGDLTLNALMQSIKEEIN